jgi:hypothetical protein
MEAVEHYAKIVLVARQLGRAEWLDHREIERLTQVRSHYQKNCS